MVTGKTIALTRWTFVGKVISLFFNMLSGLGLTFLPRSKPLLILWLQSPSAMILEPKKIKCVTVSIVSPSICHEVMGFPGGASGTEPTCQSRREVRDAGSILGLGRSSGAGHGNAHQYSCLEKSHGQRSLVGYSPWGCKESDMTKRLSTHTPVFWPG